MKRLLPFCLAIILALGTMAAYLSGISWNYFNKYKENVRDYRSYLKYQTHDVYENIIDDDTLVIFGSSELVSLSDIKEETFSFLNSDDMNIITIGGGNFQSLVHAIELGSIAADLKQKKIAVFLSPQWFSESGMTTKEFPSRYSEDHFLHTMNNPKISAEDKEYILNRCLELLEDSPMQYARMLKYKEAFLGNSIVDNVYAKMMGTVIGSQNRYNLYKQMEVDMVIKPLPTVDLADMDWDEMLSLAQSQGKAACTNNNLGINDKYFTEYCQEIYEQGKVDGKSQYFTSSPEYEDLRVFLDMAKDMDLEVALVSIPVNKSWYADYQGVLCDDYYQNIRDIAGTYENITLMDMSSYEDEKYFFKDIMHIGWKGWTRINEELYRFFKEK